MTLTLFRGADTSGDPVGSPFDATPDDAGNWSVGSPASLTPDGVYTLQAEQGSIATSTFTVDTAAPALTFTSPAAGSSTTDTRPPLRGTYGTAPNDVAGVRVRLWSGTNTAAAPLFDLTISGLTGGAWSMSPADPLPPGLYTAQATQQDQVGNVAIVEHLFTVLGPAATPAAAGTVTQTQATPVARASLLVPFPIVRIVGRPTRTGAVVTLLTAATPAGATAEARCLGRRCPVVRERHAVTARTMRVVRFRRFARAFRAGLVIEIRVTKTGRYGKYTRFLIRRRAAPRRSDRCLSPRGARRIACPTS